MKRWNPQVTINENFWNDFLASIVVFLMALPLCMGIALASGAPVEAGLITGIIGGLIIGNISGSPLQVSGPAAGLSVLVFEIIHHYGFAALSAIIVIGGVLQICMGYFRLGQLFRAVSPAVINGMLSGIGILLILSQIYVVCDFGPKESGLQNLLSLPSIVHGLATHAAHREAALLGIISILVLVFWRKIPFSALRSIPSPLMAVLVSTACAMLMHSTAKHVSVPDNILNGIQIVDFSTLASIDPWEIFRYSVALALIASAETLLSAAAVDKLHNGPRTKYDQELTAQGIGNSICGLIGGLPMTGVIARSSINVYAGAKTRMSAILHGGWLLIAVMLLPALLRHIPLAALSALLMFTGFKLIDAKSVRKLWDYGKRLVAIYAVTVIAIVTTDLLIGVAIGVVLSLAKLLYTMSRMEISMEQQGSRTVLHLRGAATFISLPNLANALEKVPANHELHVCLDELDYVDHACLELIMDWEKQHASTGGTLVMDWGELRAMFRHKRRARQKHLSAIPGDAFAHAPVTATDPFGPPRAEVAH